MTKHKNSKDRARLLAAGRDGKYTSALRADRSSLANIGGSFAADRVFPLPSTVSDVEATLDRLDVIADTHGVPSTQCMREEYFATINALLALHPDAFIVDDDLWVEEPGRRREGEGPGLVDMAGCCRVYLPSVSGGFFEVEAQFHINADAEDEDGDRAGVALIPGFSVFLTAVQTGDGSVQDKHLAALKTFIIATFLA